MKVSGLDSNGDWRFGKNLAQYKKDSEAVYQNVVTRLQCFVDDWFLDIDFGIDWFFLLGNKNTQTQIEREIERVVLETQYVKSITKLEVGKPDQNRSVTIQLAITTLYKDEISDEIIIQE